MTRDSIDDPIGSIDDRNYFVCGIHTGRIVERRKA